MELFFRRYGEGPPLIILHGLYGSSDNWISIAKNLADRFEVLLPDQRNHGSSPHSEQHDYASLRDDLILFMDRRKLDKASIMGHSMGGKVAMHLAVQAPCRVDALVVIDIAPLAYPFSGTDGQAVIHTHILDTMQSLDFNLVQSREDADNQLKSRIDNPRVRQFLLKNLERTKEGSYRWKINVQVLRTELPGILSGLNPAEYTGGKGITGFPVLFVRGEKSDYITGAMIPHIRTIFPAAEFTTIPEAGHWLHVEKGSLLTKTVKYFLLGK